MPADQLTATAMQLARVGQTQGHIEECAFYAGAAQMPGRFSNSGKRCCCCNKVEHYWSECPLWWANCKLKAHLGCRSGDRRSRAQSGRSTPLNPFQV